MMDSGARDQLVTMLRETATRDEFNEPVLTWEPIGKQWARVFYGRGDERRAAAAEERQQVATFLFPTNIVSKGLLVTDRLENDSGQWNIVKTSPVTRSHMEIEAALIT
jgi:head-tail adaptor